jgi:hypothetical protein
VGFVLFESSRMIVALFSNGLLIICTPISAVDTIVRCPIRRLIPMANNHRDVDHARVRSVHLTGADVILESALDKLIQGSPSTFETSQVALAMLFAVDRKWLADGQNDAINPFGHRPDL